MLSVAERAAAYERAGARAVSVLCDRNYFGGDFSHLAEARAACSLPLLCKDFVLDEWQVDAARAWGADAALLIVRCLEPDRLRERQPLVEVATEQEAQLAVEAEAEIVGVNARDLDTLEMDATRAGRVLESLPETVIPVHLSGLQSPADVSRVARSRAHAALVGEALMRADDPEPVLRQMVAAAD